MPIVPDTKDWTWVLERPCPECGLDTRSLTPPSVPGHILRLGSAWSSVLTGAGPTAVRGRPRDDHWSPLEYGCHVRDVFRLFDERLHLMLDQDNPTFANWDQDATAVEGRYSEQDAEQVALELEDAAQRLSLSFRSVPPASWARTGGRSDGARFSVDSFARYLVHDPVHHLYDVGAPYIS